MAFIVLMLVLLPHQGYKVLAEMIGTQGAWFYVLRGGAGVMLFLLIAALLPEKYSDALPWLAWGAMEEGMTAVCRLAIGIDNPPAGRSQCNAVTGLPVDELTLVVVLSVLLTKYGSKQNGFPP